MFGVDALISFCAGLQISFMFLTTCTVKIGFVTFSFGVGKFNFFLETFLLGVNGNRH